MPTAVEIVARALQFHQAGNLAEAEALCHQAIQADSRNADAYHLLGLIACQWEHWEQAVAWIRQAIERNDAEPLFYFNLGQAYVGLGQLDDAVSCYRHAVRMFPEDAEFHYKLGAALHLQNQWQAAVACYQEALRLHPNYAEAYNNWGSALASQGNLDAAIDHYRRALQLQPHFAAAHNNLGIALAEQGKKGEAEACYRQALRLQPDFVEALNNLGNILSSQGRLDEALTCLKDVLRHRPGDAKSRSHLASALNNMALVLADQGKLDQAVASCRRALELQADFPDALLNLAGFLSEQGNAKEARLHLQNAIAIRPTPRMRIMLATLLPPVYQSTAELHEWRQRLESQIGRLLEEEQTMDLVSEQAQPCFYLAYQGFNDRDVQSQLGSLHVAPAERLPVATPPEQGKIRIGFISSCFKEHNIAQMMGGLIAELSRQIFHVTVLSVGSHAGATAQRIRQYADTYLVVPSNLPAARRLIADQHLDVMFYTDIGMDGMTYSLAFSRLAPVQCTSWGHGITSGIPTIDYFISSIHLDKADSGQHYTEQLVRLKALAVPYYRLSTSTLPHKGRDAFGLPASGALYACLQSLFKIHPDFDAILAGILRRDAGGTVLLLEGLYPHWTKLLRQRFAKTLPDVQERIQFVPRQRYEDFLNLTAIADVLLDPTPCGGGSTTFEAMALGMPVVTLPPPLMRGRIAFALYSQMGMMDCVASSPAEYVALAVKLGTDADFRADVQAKILATNHLALENSAGLRALEQFLQQAVRHARAHLPPVHWPA
jgi:predicted O-linked N-acetylglucosamine transferase (SPINDLY family)